MSHYIIIGGNKSFPPDESPNSVVAPAHAEAGEGSTLKYEVTYTPSHALSEEQVRKNVAKLQRLCARIEALESEE